MPEQLATWNPSRDVWEAPTADLFSEQQDVFSETFPASGSMRSGSLYPRPQSEHPTGGSACSSSPGGEMPMLRTPCAQEAGGGPMSPAQAQREGRTLRLTGQIIDLIHPGVLPQ